jgi:7,8-dihydroneopterin aldolase/epimerase/oxygenase
MVTIHLKNVILPGYHGWYAEEREKGNNFEINLDVVFEDKGYGFELLEHTISYESLFNIVKSQMETATPLLEKVAMKIIGAIRNAYPAVVEISLSIFKLNPPIEGLEGKVGITICEKFKNDDRASTTL